MPVQTEVITNTDIIIYFMKLIFISLCTYFTSIKILNVKVDRAIIASTLLWNIFTSIISTIIQVNVSFSSVILFMIFSISIIFSITTKSGMGYSIIINAISLSINYCIYGLSTILGFIITLY